LAIALVLAGLLACGGSTPPPVHTPEPAPAPRPSTTHFTRLADATTLAILTTSNNVDLAYARIAAARASGRDVKAFARRMTQDHTTLNSALTFLALRLDITPREDEISRVLRDQSATRRDSLRTFTGRRFDSAYVANEVRYHQELLVAIDRVFLPSVRRPEIREFVTTLRPTISAHLAHAEQLQAALDVPARR
jgi:putative membrane protein